MIMSHEELTFSQCYITIKRSIFRPEETVLEYRLQFDTHLLKCYNQAV